MRSHRETPLCRFYSTLHTAVHMQLLDVRPCRCLKTFPRPLFRNYPLAAVKILHQRLLKTTNQTLFKDTPSYCRSQTILLQLFQNSTSVAVHTNGRCSATPCQMLLTSILSTTVQE